MRMTIDTPIGSLTLCENEGMLTHILLPNDPVPADQEPGCTPLLEQAALELREYSSGKRREFTVPLNPQGTAFMRACWEQLVLVPFGQTASYGQIAQRMGNPKAVRAVGAVNGRNPIPIIIPCHRIVGSDGKLTGFRGGLAMKQQLLELERGHAVL